MKEKILITCFEPFGGECFNASMAVAEEMPAQIGDMSAEKVLLPVEFGRSAEMAEEKAEALGARLVVCLGEARGRSAVTPEMLAINLKYASVPDNAGNSPRDEAVCEGGENAYFTPFPARRLALRIKENGVPAALSYSAGAYVCNDLYYRLLQKFSGSDTRVIFIHLPRENGGKTYADMAFAVSKALADVISAEDGEENVK